MRLRVALALVVAVATAAVGGADQALTVPQEYLDQIVDERPNPLPRGLTAEEGRLPLPQTLAPFAPPSGTIHTPAEYEASAGMIIRWGSYNDVLTAMTVGVTTGDPEAIVYIVVDGASMQSSATTTLTGAGADMSQVEFITYNTDSVWMRDYGPRFIFEDGALAMVDHTYNRPRPLDDAFPDFLASLWGISGYDIPLTHGGGNFHLFAPGDADMTELIVNENPSLTEAQIQAYYLAYQNLDLTIRTPFPTSFDSTQHIDMWFLPVDDDEVIIGQYSSSTGTPYTVTEAVVADLQGQGYTVHRTPGWSSGGTHYTYTNAVIVNDLVFVPKFAGSWTTQDAQALAVFQTAFDGKQVIQVNCASIITAAGAMHCIVMQVPELTTTMQVTPGAGLAAGGPVGGPFTPASVDYTVENHGASAIDFTVAKTQPWVTLSTSGGSIPAAGSTTVTVSIGAAANALGSRAVSDVVPFTHHSDHSGDTTRAVDLLVGAPEAVYELSFDTDPGWTTQGQWAFGVPTGAGGAYGPNDPTAGHTGSNVYGYNLSGDYAASIPEYHLTSTAFDCSQLSGVELRFWRWLGVETPTYDHAYVRVSNDGTNWTTVWQNTATVEDAGWTEQVLDISAVADGQATVYLRWTMGVTDDAWQYCGWNLDDIALWGVVEAPPTGLIFADGFDSGDVTGWSTVSAK